MKVLVACEHKGAVRDAFRARGHQAYSCDLLPDVSGSPYHIQKDVLSVLDEEWDLMIAHPPCTYLCSSGLHWNTKRVGRHMQTLQALAFVDKLLNAPIPKVAIENPVGCIGTKIRKASQYIQPYQFGHDHSKTTGLWLVGLPNLMPTDFVSASWYNDKGLPRWSNQTPQGQDKTGPSSDRWAKRSKTFTGIAKAMSEQWG